MLEFKRRAATVVLFIPSGIALFSEAALIMINTGCILALLFLGRELVKPWFPSFKS